MAESKSPLPREESSTDNFSTQCQIELESLNQSEWCCASFEKSFAKTSSEFLSTFEVTNVLGHGDFGVVYQVKKIHINDPFDVTYWPDSGHPQPLRETVIAVKIIPEGRLSEASFAARLCHPHIVSCYNVWAEQGTSDEFKSLVSILSKKSNTSSSTSNTIAENTKTDRTGYIIPPYLLMQFEFCTEGTLDDLLLKRAPDPTNRLKYYAQNQNLFMQILEGILFMENKKIVHGDLKPNNIFLTRRRNGALIAKIGDFGLNQKSTVGLAVKEPKDGLLNSETPEIMETTLKRMFDSRNLYRSPEQAKISCFQALRAAAQGSFHESDIYSLGLMFIPMLIQFPSKLAIRNGPEVRKVRESLEARNAVFMAMQEERLRKKEPSWKFLGSAFPQEIKWIEKMIDHDMAKRPTATEVKQWTLEGPPGYEIDYGEIVPTIKTKLYNILATLKILDDFDMDELDESLKAIKRRFYFHLLELVYEALISLPVDDELLLEILEYHRDYKDTSPSSPKDKLYLYKNFIPKLEAATGLENLRTLKWVYSLAICLLESDHEESFKNYEKLQNSKLYKELGLLHPFKIEVESSLLFVKCPTLEEEDYSKQTKFVYKMQELETVLRKCEQMYLALTNISKRDIFSDWTLINLFIVKLKLLVFLGRSDEAEILFVEMFANINLKLEQDETFNVRKLTRFYICYSQFLERHKRYEESINILESVCKFEDQAGRLDALNCLAICHLKMNNFCMTDPKFKETSDKILIEKEIQKAQGLLPDPEQFKLEDATAFNYLSKHVDFELID